MCSSPEGDAISEWDQYVDESGKSTQGKKHANMWVGATYLFTKGCADPKAALASIKRDKGEAKKKARAQGFSYLDQLFEDQPCMTKPVTVMLYDMKPFLQSCVDRYVQLAGRDAKPIKKVATPCHEERIARPVIDESEPKGVLAPIAARILMKILFAAIGKVRLTKSRSRLSSSSDEMVCRLRPSIALTCVLHRLNNRCEVEGFHR
jgi:hypothetical protein